MPERKDRLAEIVRIMENGILETPDLEDIAIDILDSDAIQEMDQARREVVNALADLVRLKDGPKDEEYRAAKDAAWDRARAALEGMKDRV